MKYIRILTIILLTLTFNSCGRVTAGPPGATGPQGQPGTPAQPCTVTTVSGGVQINCPNGSSATVTNGTNGLNGLNGTSVTAIQFCPNSFVPSYPNTFTEFGLCIGGQMYGVFSLNDGFWALLPPGTYSSDGVNASCTFTIEPNCVISD